MDKKKGSKETNVKNKYKNKYKGSFVGSGAYGMVFRPPIPCVINRSEKEYEKFNSTDFVGKCFKLWREAKREYNVQKKVNRIDPTHLFTLCVWSICPMNLTINKLSHVLSPQVRGKTRFQGQIISDYGGQNFLKHLLAPKASLSISAFQPFINRVFFFVENVARMNRAGMYHFDIKEDNVLFNSNRGLLTLIDFDFFSNSINRMLGYALDKNAEGSGPYNIPPELRAVSGILYAESLIKKKKKSDADISNQQTNYDFMIVDWANRATLKDILSVLADLANIPPGQKSKTYTKKISQLFTKFSEWYKLPGDDALFLNIKGPIYNSILSGAKKFSRTKDKRPLLSLFNNKFLKERFESWSMGILLFQWVATVYPRFKKSNVAKNILEHVLFVICNDMIQADVSKRKSVPQVHKELILFLSKNFEKINQNLSDFSRETKERHKSMKWCSDA